MVIIAVKAVTGFEITIVIIIIIIIVIAFK